MNTHHRQLRPGQEVHLVALESGLFRVAVLPPGQAGLRVVEVGPDHIACQDDAAGVTTRVPSHLIASVAAPPAADDQAA